MCAASDRSILVSFGDQMSVEIHRDIVRLTRALHGTRGILNLHPAFTTLLIDFDPRLRDHAEIEALVRERIDHPGEESPTRPRTVEVPVRFGGEFGPDLDDVASHTGFAPRKVIELFCAAEYEVYFVGFSTCFPYLGGLPAELATPRLRAPRKHVPEGSVAIGGSQAGVYPLASPGGWRLIGRTSLRLFDPGAEPPPLLRMSDRVLFRAEER
ncbi:MAG TPA: 5-oxoprolinase subunit PxpB [Verrucomicrobiae bacterium]|nr:5-oxoprolinase subunit PxpB [Verrucomicrobiae bacterium]